MIVWLSFCLLNWEQCSCTWMSFHKYIIMWDASRSKNVAQSGKQTVERKRQQKKKNDDDSDVDADGREYAMEKRLFIMILLFVSIKRERIFTVNQGNDDGNH